MDVQQLIENDPQLRELDRRARRYDKPGMVENSQQLLYACACGWGTGSSDLRGYAIVASILDDLIQDEVREMREPNPQDGRPEMSWAQIGAALGVSKQAAQQRYGQRVKQD